MAEEENNVQTHEDSSKLNEFTVFAAETVAYFREHQSLTPEQLKKLQEIKIQSLVPNKRERIQNAIDRTAKLSTEQDETLAGYRLIETGTRLRAARVDRYAPSDIQEFHSEAERLKELNEDQERIFREIKEITIQEIAKDAEGGLETDPFTGLHTREALMTRLSEKLVKAKESKDTRILRSIEIRAGDMNNFKQGNDILGHKGFDDLLQQEFATRFIALSAYLEGGEYGEEFSQEEFDRMFPPGSEERDRIDKAKGKVAIDLYRMKAGADEVYTTTEYLNLDITESERNELRKLSDRIVNDTFNSVVIGKHQPKELNLIAEFYKNSLNFFTVKESENTSAGHAITLEETLFWQAFSGHIRGMLGNSDQLRGITEDPNAVLRLSADMSRHYSLAEALRMLMTGRDSEGNQVGLEINGTLLGVDQKLDRENARAVISQIDSTLTRKFASTGASSEEEFRNTVELAAANVATGLLLERAMKYSEDTSKPEGKRKLIVDAWTGRGKRPTEDAYNLGSLLSVGRLKQEMADPAKAREVFVETFTVYTERMREEMAKIATALKGTAGTEEDLKKILTSGEINIPIVKLYVKVASTIKSRRNQIELDKGNPANKAALGFFDSLPPLPELPDGVDMDDLPNTL